MHLLLFLVVECKPIRMTSGRSFFLRTMYSLIIYSLTSKPGSEVNSRSPGVMVASIFIFVYFISVAYFQLNVRARIRAMLASTRFFSCLEFTFCAPSTLNGHLSEKMHVIMVLISDGSTEHGEHMNLKRYFPKINRI